MTDDDNPRPSIRSHRTRADLAVLSAADWRCSRCGKRANGVHDGQAVCHVCQPPLRASWF